MNEIEYKTQEWKIKGDRNNILGFGIKSNSPSDNLVKLNIWAHEDDNDLTF